MIRRTTFSTQTQMRLSSLRWRTGAVVCAAAGALLMARSSHAVDAILGVDLNYVDALDQPATDNGIGVDVRVGPRFEAVPLTASVEVSAGYHNFSGTLEPSVYRGLVGGQLGLGGAVRPGVFSHLGIGWLRYDELVGGERETRTDLAGDLGLALDFTVAPELDLGIHGAYNYVAGANVFEWWQTGARATFVLGGS